MPDWNFFSLSDILAEKKRKLQHMGTKMHEVVTCQKEREDENFLLFPSYIVLYILTAFWEVVYSH